MFSGAKAPMLILKETYQAAEFRVRALMEQQLENSCGKDPRQVNLFADLSDSEFAASVRKYITCSMKFKPEFVARFNKCADAFIEKIYRAGDMASELADLTEARIISAIGACEARVTGI